MLQLNFMKLCSSEIFAQNSLGALAIVALYKWGCDSWIGAHICTFFFFNFFFFMIWWQFICLLLFLKAVDFLFLHVFSVLSCYKTSNSMSKPMLVLKV
jgi:hypothetical protein